MKYLKAVFFQALGSVFNHIPFEHMKLIYIHIFFVNYSFLAQYLYRLCDSSQLLPSRGKNNNKSDFETKY